MDGDQLMEPDLGMPDFIKAISTSRPTVNQSDLEQQVKFTQEFGQEGWVRGILINKRTESIMQKSLWFKLRVDNGVILEL